MTIRIGSRKSDLAKIQAYEVGEALLALDEVSDIEYVFKSSLGDQNQDDPLWQMPEKGVFTQDLTKDLIESKVDLVVHSWKDLPVEERAESLIAATLKRADMRDVLIVRKDRLSKIREEKHLKIFSSSPRRAHNLSHFLSWALPGGEVQTEFEVVRGNVQTRVRKLLESNKVAALVVAKAALDRLLGTDRDEFSDTREFLSSALKQCEFMILPLKENPTAAAQGALAIEVLKSRNDLLGLLENLNVKQVFDQVQAERQILKSHGGGCHQKIGVSILKRGFGQIKSLRGVTEAGEEFEDWTIGSSSVLKSDSQNSFPLSMADARIFEDRDIQYDQEKLKSAMALIISKARALPDDYPTDSNQIFWVAGSRSWRKLAERGYWVHGSFEGLGEQEDPRLDTLVGSPPKWLKLTHRGALEHSEEGAVATYELTDSELPATLSEKFHFFWTSYSSFKRAVEVYPHLIDRDHSCGPGRTAELIEKFHGIRPRIFLSFKEWRNEFK